MKNKIGRNDACPCNSGKKFKHCCLKKDPKERFSVNVTDGNPNDAVGVVYKNGKWIETPGFMPKMRLGVVNKKDIDENVNNVIRSLNLKIPENHRILKEKLGTLRHKLMGIKYHKTNFEKNEDVFISQFNKEYKGSSIEIEEHKPEIIYELESFLFQVKSALDVLAQIIGRSYDITLVTYSNGGKKITETLKQNSPKEMKDSAEKIILIIQGNEKWVTDLVDMRDAVAHFSNIDGVTCFIQHSWFGKKTAEISYPTMPDGERIRTYMEDISQTLLKFIQDIFLIIEVSQKSLK